MKNKNNLKWRFLYRLHRYLGLFSAIILLMLAVTGIALNHTEYLKLDSRMIQCETILDWYGVKSADNPRSFSTKNHWITQINQHLYFDSTLLLENTENLIGVIKTEEFIVAALYNSLLLLSLEGELIEQIPKKAIQQIGFDYQHRNSVYIRTKGEVVKSKDGLLSWHFDKNPNIIWSKTSPIPKPHLSEIKHSFRSSILPLERVVLDIHSGRIFGLIGVFIVDLAGIFLILITLSGCSIWVKHKLRHFYHSSR